MRMICKTCGKEFRKTPGEISNGRQFCSFSCYRKYHGENLLEKTFRLALENLEIPYIQEAKIGRYSIDFIIKDTKIAIEVDGTYWHRNHVKDMKKTVFLKKYGWIVIRFKEVDIRNAIDVEMLVIDRLKQIIDFYSICRHPPLPNNK